MLGPDEFIYPLERLVEFAQRQFVWIREHVANSDTFMPQLSVVLKDPETGEESVTLMALAVPFNTHEEKHSALLQIGMRLYPERKVPVLAVFMSEAWSSRDEKYSAGNGKLPEQDPNREEIVVLFGATFCSKCCCVAHLPVTRNAGKKMQPGEWSELQTEGVRLPLLNSLWAGFGAAAKYGPAVQIARQIVGAD